MFPDDVERWPEFDQNKRGEWVEGEMVVSSSDFDKLLALYREHVPAHPCTLCGQEAKGSKAHVVGDPDSPVCSECIKNAF
jgi:hypothetical protein